jgi:hypothetical protein
MFLQAPQIQPLSAKVCSDFYPLFWTTHLPDTGPNRDQDVDDYDPEDMSVSEDDCSLDFGSVSPSPCFTSVPPRFASPSPMILEIGNSGTVTPPKCVKRIDILKAELALKHATQQFKQIGTAFCQTCIISTGAAYTVQVGFNDDMICSGTGILQEIYVYVNFDISGNPKLVLGQLGKILSPFPGRLFTPKEAHTIPILSASGEALNEAQVIRLLESSGVFVRDPRICEGNPTQVPAHPGGSTQGHASGGSNSVERSGWQGYVSDTTMQPPSVHADRRGNPSGSGSGGFGGGGSGGNLLGAGLHEERQVASGSGSHNLRFSGTGGGEPDSDPGGSWTNNTGHDIRTLAVPLTAAIRVEWDKEPRMLQEFNLTSNIDVMVWILLYHNSISNPSTDVFHVSDT